MRYSFILLILALLLISGCSHKQAAEEQTTLTQEVVSYTDCVNAPETDPRVVPIISNQDNRQRIEHDIAFIRGRLDYFLTAKSFELRYCEVPQEGIECEDYKYAVIKQNNTLILRQRAGSELLLTNLTKEQFLRDYTALGYLEYAYNRSYQRCEYAEDAYLLPLPREEDKANENPYTYTSETGKLVFNSYGVITFIQGVKGKPPASYMKLMDSEVVAR